MPPAAATLTRRSAESFREAFTPCPLISITRFISGRWELRSRLLESPTHCYPQRRPAIQEVVIPIQAPPPEFPPTAPRTRSCGPLKIAADQAFCTRTTRPTWPRSCTTAIRPEPVITFQTTNSSRRRLQTAKSTSALRPELLSLDFCHSVCGALKKLPHGQMTSIS